MKIIAKKLFLLDVIGHMNICSRCLSISLSFLAVGVSSNAIPQRQGFVSIYDRSLEFIIISLNFISNNF